MNRIILSGIKHSGKSTVGKNLSFRFGVLFADLDELILQDAKESQSIREIYNNLGPEGFKDLEQKSLNKFLNKNKEKSFVLSLGGGTIENKVALEIMSSEKNTYFLDADCEVLFERVIKGGIPPFINKENPLQSFREMYNRRKKSYLSWAKNIIDTRGLNPEEISGKTEKIILKMDQT